MARARASHLDELDAVLLDVRAMVQQPRYRQRLLSALGRHVDLGTVRALRVVERAGGLMPSVGEVAEAMAIDPSSASRLIDRCVNEGLLYRGTSEQDRRRSRLELTTSGRSVLDSASAARRQLLEEVTSDWPGADVEQLVALLTRLQAGFEHLERRP
jgi:DNA-binding MarR family transcriptional regulator